MDAGVRRHQSLNYPNANAAMRRLGSGLRRAGTLQAPPLKGQMQPSYSGAQSPSPTGADEYDDDNDSILAQEDNDYFHTPSQQGQGQYPTSPIGRSSPWSTPGAGNDWRTQLAGNANPNIGAAQGGIDDVSRALSSLEISQQYAAGNAGNGYQQGQSAYPPRFNPPNNFNLNYSGMRNNGGAGNSASRKLQLVTDLDNQMQQGSIQSASAYVPPIGHGLQQGQSQRQNERDEQPHHRERSFTASGSGPWDNKERFVGNRMSQQNMHNVYQGKNGNGGIPSTSSLSSQYINNQGQAPRLGLASQGNQQASEGRGSSGSNPSPPADNLITSPIDVPTLIATKGYNPADFDTRPLFVSHRPYNDM